MSSPLPTTVILSTTLGLCLSTTFSIASLSLTYFAIPAVLLPRDAPLMPPLELVTEKSARRFNTDKAPKQPFDSGAGDEKEGLLDGGATQKVLRNDNGSSGSPSDSSYLLRQWFHLFSKGMHALPPSVLGGALCYGLAGFMLPGEITDTGDILLKRGCFGLATVLSVCTMVFTLTALKPVNTALHERVKEIVKQEQGDGTKTVGVKGNIDDKRHETEALVREWGKMNAYRALIPFMAASCAVVGLVI